MEVWQIILLSYVGALVVWLIINSLVLIISMAVKHKVFMVVEAITYILSPFFGIATSIGDLVLIIWLFSIGQIFWAIIAIVVGVGVVSFIGSILSAPFIWITACFSTWYDSMKEHE